MRLASAAPLSSRMGPAAFVGMGAVLASRSLQQVDLLDPELMKAYVLNPELMEV